MKIYTFTIEIGGIGNNPHEAYRDAVERFAEDPGETPRKYEEGHKKEEETQ